LFGFYPAYQLGARVVKELAQRNSLDTNIIDDVVFGNVMNSDCCNVARMVALDSDLGVSVTGVTVNRQCGSGLNAFAYAAAMIRSGSAKVMVAGGVESDSNRPYLMEKPSRAYPHTTLRLEPSVKNIPPRFDDYPMGITAEDLAVKFNVSREDCDRYAVDSHRRAEAVWNEGVVDDCVLPVSVEQRRGPPNKVGKDETGIATMCIGGGRGISLQINRMS